MTSTDWLVAGVLVAMFVPNTAFALWYGLSKRWYGSPEGWALLASSTAWALVSGGFLVEYVQNVHDLLWACIGFVAATAGWMKLLLLATSKRRRQHHTGTNPRGRL